MTRRTRRRPPWRTLILTPPHGTGLRPTIGWALRCLADRLDHEHAPRVTGMSMTLERHRGWVLNWENRGIPVAYLGEHEYDRAHTEANDSPFTTRSTP